MNKLIFLTTLAFLACVPAMAAEKPTKADQQTLSREWAEVSKKYPHVAAAHLQALEALAQSVEFAKSINEPAFRVSRAYSFLQDLCSRPAIAKSAICQGVDRPKPESHCPNCTGACTLDETIVDCFHCRQARADAGCF